MKTPRPDSDSRWEKLLRQAQADAGPPADLTALLRAVRQAPPAAQAGWATEFTALFSSARIVSGCLAGATACALFTTWQVWDSWQALPWAQLLITAAGGEP